MHRIEWLSWEELSSVEQEQAVQSYIMLRAEEEGIPEEEVDYNIGYIKEKRFERMVDGYIYVDL